MTVGGYKVWFSFFFSLSQTEPIFNSEEMDMHRPKRAATSVLPESRNVTESNPTASNQRRRSNGIRTQIFFFSSDFFFQSQIDQQHLYAPEKKIFPDFNKIEHFKRVNYVSEFRSETKRAMRLKIWVIYLLPCLRFWYWISMSDQQETIGITLSFIYRRKKIFSFFL